MAPMIFFVSLFICSFNEQIKICPQGGNMRNYELITLFNTKNNGYTTGLEQVKEILSKRKVSITKEENMGDKELAYEVKGEQRGHYHLFNLEIDPEIILKIDSDLKLNQTV
jgi:small subunit ribosomal protein S6